MAVRIQFRRGTYEQWNTTNPTLVEGELAYDTTNKNFKVGPGLWSSLPPANIGTITSINSYGSGSGILVYSNNTLGGASAGAVSLAVDTVNTVMSRSLVTEKGAILTATASSQPTSLAKGTNGQVLTVNTSVSATHLEWQSGYVKETSTQTLTNKTLTSPTVTTPTITGGTLTGGTLTNSSLVAPFETWSVSTSAAPATTPVYLKDSGAYYYSGTANTNITLNFTGNSTGTTLNSMLSVGQSVTAVVAVSPSGTSHYPTAIQVDGTAVTSSVKWQGSVIPTSSNSGAIDLYSFLILKTADAAFTVLGAQTKFAR